MAMEENPSGWQTCRKGWTRVEGESIMTPNRATEKTVNNTLAQYILNTKGHGPTLQEIKDAKETVASTVREIYTKIANTAQLGKAIKVMQNNKASVQNNCWLCGLHIFNPSKFTDIGGSTCLGYQEAEHVLPLKIGHKLLSLPGQKIRGVTKIDVPLYNDQIQLEMKNSHRLCNQIKSNINFIKFSGGWKGIWSIKDTLVTEFIKTINGCMTANNKCGTPPPFNGEATKDLMVKGLRAVCVHLNDVSRPPEWKSVSNPIKGLLNDALVPYITSEKWNSPLGYILYRYSSKIARLDASPETITKYIHTTYDRYKDDSDDNVHEDINEMAGISQSITADFYHTNADGDVTPSSKAQSEVQQNNLRSIKNEVLRSVAEDGVPNEEEDEGLAQNIIKTAVAGVINKRTERRVRRRRVADHEQLKEEQKNKAASVARGGMFLTQPQNQPPSAPPSAPQSPPLNIFFQNLNNILNKPGTEISELSQSNNQ
jgi:hypothetical protein